MKDKNIIKISSAQYSVRKKNPATECGGVGVRKPLAGLMIGPQINGRYLQVRPHRPLRHGRIVRIGNKRGSQTHPNFQRHQLQSQFILHLLFLTIRLKEIEYTNMAARRIPALCLATPSRNALFTSHSQFTPRRLAPLRQLQTTPIRRDQQQANIKAKRDPAPKIVRGGSKLYKNADAAVADLKSGSTILSAGFGLCGTAGENFPSPFPLLFSTSTKFVCVGIQKQLSQQSNEEESTL